LFDLTILLGGLRSKDNIDPATLMHVKTIIGSRPDFSATTGAIIVTNLAKKLQKPRAVAQKSVGKRSTVDTYTITKPLATPNLTKAMKRGIKFGLLIPKNKINRPPKVETIKVEENANRIPSLLSKTPPATLPSSSAPELAILLLKTSPGRYLS
jgi:hypothetical protein